MPPPVATLGNGGHTKVRELHLTSGCQQDISALDIPVNDPNSMKVLKSLEPINAAKRHDIQQGDSKEGRGEAQE